MKNPISIALAFCLCMLAYGFTVDTPADATLMQISGEASCSQPAVALPQTTYSCSDHAALTPPPENYSGSAGAAAYGSYTTYGSSSGSSYDAYASHSRAGLFRGRWRNRGGWRFRPNAPRAIFNSRGECLNCG